MVLIINNINDNNFKHKVVITSKKKTKISTAIRNIIKIIKILVLLKCAIFEIKNNINERNVEY